MAETLDQSKTDQWAWWREAVDLIGRSQPIGDINAEHPESGFYRRVSATRETDKAPVAYWRDKDGDLHCKCGDDFISSPEEQRRLWLWVAKHPVSKKAYDARRQSGHWPDEVAPVTPGSNLPTDPFENVKARVEGALERARDFLRALQGKGEPTKPIADQARNLQVDVQRLAKEAESLRKTQKAPILEAGREIEARFDTVSEPLGKANAALERIWKTYAAAEEDRLKKEAAAAYERERAAAEAERKRIAAEHEARLRDDPIAALTEPEPAFPEIPTGPAPVKVQVGGLSGPKASLRSKRELVITDWDKALAHYKAHDEVRKVIEKLARADQKDGIALDFIKIEKVAA